MSIPDEVILPYFEYLTDLSDRELSEMKSSLDEASVNPMELKKKLAGELVSQFHGKENARIAETYFKQTIQLGEVPDNTPEYDLPADLKDKRLSHILLEAKLVSSVAEAKRLIDQGAVRYNDIAITTNVAADTLGLRTDGVLRAGRSRIVKISNK
jgi:tyrosyl-tRNA synthetase